jgi:hypothetical protein
MTGAENHQPHGNHSSAANDGAGYDSTPHPEGEYYERMHWAMQAFSEYMPLRETSTADMDSIKAAVKAGAKSPQSFPGSPAKEVTDALRGVLASQTRAFDFGGLLTLMATEGRIGYRTSSAAVNNDGKMMPPSLAAAGTAVAAATAPVLAKGGPVNWTAADYASIHSAFLTQAYSKDFYNDPAERIIGETTVEKMGKVFADSKAAGIPFQVFLSQTVFQPTSGSDWLGGSSSTARTAAKKMAAYAASACNSWWKSNCLTTKSGIPWNTDAWDGFHNERLKVIAAMSKGNNPIVNSGDAHGYWISGIKEQGFNGTKMVAAEFAGGSVTSQGWGDYFPTSGGPVFGYTLGPANNPWLEMLEDGFVAANARYGEVASFHKHGSLVFHVTKDAYVGNVMTVDTINGRVVTV